MTGKAIGKDGATPVLDLLALKEEVLTAVREAAFTLTRNANTKSEAVRMVIRVEDNLGRVWGLNAPLTRYGSKYDGMSPEAVRKVKAEAALVAALKEARDAGVSLSE